MEPPDLMMEESLTTLPAFILITIVAVQLQLMVDFYEEVLVYKNMLSADNLYEML